MRYLKIPHIPQKAESDCLVACAAIMLAALGLNANYLRLQSLLGFEDEGIPYSKIRLFARLYSDVQVTLRQGEIPDLMRAIDAGTPPAVFVDTGELSYWPESVYHAVVLVGYTDTDFYVHDPAFAQAPQLAPIGELDLAWLEYDAYFAVVQRKS